MTDLELPRRLCSDDPDAGLFMPVYVWLDGVEQQDVCSYDLDAGTVVRLKRDAAGNGMFDEAKGELILETLRGDVRAARTRAAEG